MLTLQLNTASGWQTVGVPYHVADALRVQHTASALSQFLGCVWRVLGDGGRVLTVYDGRRWQSVAETQSVQFWQQEPASHFPTTMVGD